MSWVSLKKLLQIDFTFSYSSSDSAGTRSIVTDDPEIEDQYSIAEYIKAFPRNFTLAKDQLNWIPKVQLEEGLLKTIEYFNKINV